MQPDSTKTRGLWTLVATAALLLVLLAQPALAIPITKQWVGTPFNNLWTTASNWSPSGEPGAGDDVLVTQSGFFPETVIYNTLANPLLSSLTVNATGWGNITLQQSGNALSATNETIGLDGKGVYNQSGGTNTVSNATSYVLYLGYNPTGKGTYNLSGSGSLLADTEVIGNQGTGIFNQSGGSNTTTQYLTLGNIHSASGTYNLVSGVLSSNIEFVGNAGTGTFNQSSGTHTVSGYLGVGNSDGIGTYNLKGGNLQADGEIIGVSGTGTFNQTGGSNTVSFFYLGFQSTSLGTYNLWSGNLTVTDFERVGGSGNGNFTQSGGTHKVDGDIYFGKTSTGSGAYQMYGGSLQVSGTDYIGSEGTGVFTQSGGSHTVGNSLILADQPGSSGTYNLQKGSLKVIGNEFIGNFGTGTFTQTGGTHTVTQTLALADNGGSSGTYNLRGGTLSAKNINIFPGGTFNVKNTITTVAGDVENLGTVKTTNALVTWDGNFTNNGAYISDHATQTFTDLTVPDPPISTGYLVGNSQDVFKIKNDFNNMSTNASAWDTAAATLQFVTGDDKSHNFYVAGADHGSSYNYSNTEFSWGTLNILGQTVHLLDGNTTNIGTAQYVKVLLGADVNYATRFVNNIFDDAGSPINIYYDPKALANLYLFGLDYTFAGGGQLIADAAVPLPPSVFLLGSGLLGLGLLGWRRRRG